MDVNLEELKKNFLKIKDIRIKVSNVFGILEEHLMKLKMMYSEFVENNRQNQFVFGLDSFQFQSKLIDIEFEDMKRMFLAINNRIYCEYYKLYNIMADFVRQNITDKKTIDIINITNNLPIYKDLEPYKQYKFELIQLIHENIILLLYGINEFIINKDSELQIHKKKQNNGLNINNFVTTFNYNIVIIRENGLLFVSYINFFHNLHTKYLQRFSMKMNLMYNQIISDIHFEDNLKFNTKKNMIGNGTNDQFVSKLNNSPIKGVTIGKDTLGIQNSNDSLDMDITSNTSSSDKSLKNKFKQTTKKLISGLRMLKANEQKANEQKDIDIDISNTSKISEQTKTIDNVSIENVSDESRSIDTYDSREPPKTPHDLFAEISQQCEDFTNENKSSFEQYDDILTKNNYVEENTHHDVSNLEIITDTLSLNELSDSSNVDININLEKINNIDLYSETEKKKERKKEKKKEKKEKKKEKERKKEKNNQENNEENA